MRREKTASTATALAPELGRHARLEELAARFDRWNMARVIDGLPAQFEAALVQEMPTLPTGPFDEVLVVGMGGSALPVEVLLDAFADLIRVPVKVCRGYGLPRPRGRRRLVVASSFSGTTEEVLLNLEELCPRTDEVVAVSSGGDLEVLARKRGYPHVRVPKEREPERFQPRSAVGYLTTFFARVLARAGVIDDPRAGLESLPAFLRSAAIRRDAEAVALWLGDRIPVIYTDESHLLSIARVSKIKFNENAKRPAFFNAFPEANHNEMIGFTKPLAKFGVLYLHDPTSHRRVEGRFEVMQQVFRDEGLDHVGFRRWELPGSTRAERVIASLVFAECCSYTLALLDGVDPTPVALVERFKDELAALPC